MPVGCGISLARRGTSFTTSVGCSNPGGVHTVQENALKQELEEALTQGKGSVKGSKRVKGSVTVLKGSVKGVSS